MVKKVLGLLLVLVGLFALVACGGSERQPSIALIEVVQIDTEPQRRDEVEQIINNMARDVILEWLDEPETATFSPMDTWRHSFLSIEIYSISGYVTSYNFAGVVSEMAFLAFLNLETEVIGLIGIDGFAIDISNPELARSQIEDARIETARLANLPNVNAQIIYDAANYTHRGLGSQAVETHNTISLEQAHEIALMLQAIGMDEIIVAGIRGTSLLRIVPAEDMDAGTEFRVYLSHWNNNDRTPPFPIDVDSDFYILYLFDENTQNFAQDGNWRPFLRHFVRVEISRPSNEVRSITYRGVDFLNINEDNVLAALMTTISGVHTFGQ